MHFLIYNFSDCQLDDLALFLTVLTNVPLVFLVRTCEVRLVVVTAKEIHEVARCRVAYRF